MYNKISIYGRHIDYTLIAFKNLQYIVNVAFNTDNTKYYMFNVC